MIIFITGVRGGLGRAFAEAALADGHTVVGTVRTGDAVAEFERLAPGRAIGRVLDVGAGTDHLAQALVADVEATAGAIDVLIANAGYGHEGSFEESSMDELRAQFAVNVFGPVALMKAVLPGMRVRRRGHIITITSVGGLVPGPTLSFYNGSKFALEGITRALAAEVAAFGVRVTAVAPGAFRTEWSGRSMVRATRGIADYDGLVDRISAARAAFNGSQPGDPARAAAAVMRLISLAEPPVQLLLGSDALAGVTTALQASGEQIARNRDLTLSTDHPA
ncbi:oxidoreductase [Catenuloplanes japonicus]|uniref:oxidoreductase n=1 Tax=Catenuloplanes japonicus TaxID=33876 RepID=UPI0005268FB4|nr:oxidoreductase [Catenuloplanes japonicus]